MKACIAGLLLLAASNFAVFGQTLHTEATFESPVAIRSAILCQHGSQVAGIGDDQAIYIWTESAKAPRRILIPNTEIHDISCAGDGTVAAALSDHSVALVDPASGEIRKRIDVGGRLSVAALSPDASQLAIAMGLGPTQLVDVKSAKTIATTRTKFGSAWTAAYSPAGDLFVSADGDTMLRGYDRSGRLLYAADGGLLEGFSLSFSADGQQFAAAGADGIIRLFDSGSGKLLKEAPGVDHPIVALQMSPDGQRIAAYSIDDFSFAPIAISLWDVRSGKVTALPVDPKTCVGTGMNRSHLLLIEQDAAKRLTVASVQ